MGNMVENMTPEMAMGMLKYIQSNDIIDLSYVQEMKEMAERDRYLQQHPYKIWQGKDGKWRTYLPDETKANGRKLIKRTSEEDIKKEVTKYYRKEAENPTIQEVFEEWNDRRLQLGKIAPSTHERNCQTFKRHYSEMGEMRIKQIDEDRFCDFLEEQISEKQLTAKAFSNLKSITKGFLKRAKKRKLIQYSVEEMMQDMDTSDSVFQRSIKEEDEVVFSEDELPQYIECLEKDMDLKNLGILLMFLTGIRVGDDDDKIRLNQRKPSKYKGLSRFGPEKNLQRINKFMKERPTFYKKLIQMKENFRFYLRCFYCITKVVILQFNSEKQDRISS